MKNIKLNRKGFTLVELLAVITVLSLVVTIAIYIVTNVIVSSKENTYQVTINNIERESANYLLENSNEIFFVNNGIVEYQCIMVKNLVDAGYFKNDIVNSKVAEDRNVSMDDYIYIERDIDTKSVIRKTLLLELNEDSKRLCDNAVKAKISVAFGVLPNTWSKTKDVSITYKLDKPNRLSEYKYRYDVGDTAKDIEGNNTYKDFNNFAVVEKYTATDTGMVMAEVLYNEKDATSYTREITGIDKTPPEINLISEGDNLYTKSKSLLVTLTDMESGLDDGIKVRYGWSVSSSTEPSSYIDASLKYTDNDRKASFNALGSEITGLYYLWIKLDNFKDKAGNIANLSIRTSKGTFAFDNVVPVVSISKSNYNTFNYIGVDDDSGIDGYYISNSSEKPTLDSGWINTTSKVISDKGTYYVYVKDKAGNISEAKTISAYKISINLGEGTTISSRYDSTGSDNGNSFSNSIVVLAETNIWVSATANTGYSNAIIKNNGSSVQNPAVIKVLGDVNISSSASANTYKISYNANGGSNAPGDTTYIYASTGTINLSSSKPTRSGYNFLGWSKEEGAGSATYSAGGTWNRNVAENTTLYAVWKKRASSSSSTITPGSVPFCGQCSKDSDCQSGYSCVQRYCSRCKKYNKKNQCLLWDSCQ